MPPRKYCSYEPKNLENVVKVVEQDMPKRPVAKKKLVSQGPHCRTCQRAGFLDGQSREKVLSLQQLKRTAL